MRVFLKDFAAKPYLVKTANECFWTVETSKYPNLFMNCNRIINKVVFETVLTYLCLYEVRGPHIEVATVEKESSL